MAAPLTLLEKTKKQLRSVLLSEKNGVAAERLERDYRDLVSRRCLFRGWVKAVGFILTFLGWRLDPLPGPWLPFPGVPAAEPAGRVQPAGRGVGGGGQQGDQACAGDGGQAEQ